MIDDSRIPPELRDLDAGLRKVRFEPRASFGPELLGRLRHGERAGGVVSPRRFRQALLGAAASLVLAVGSALLYISTSTVEIDRCCYDLDGGGDADDGVMLLAERDARVHHLTVYEDRDRSGHFSPGDVVRLDRGGEPVMHPASGQHLVTTEHCCLDFDGGGPDDDALVVIGVPPDRVMMAAIYERRPDAARSQRGADAFQLR
jgi:hypothetical protein